MKAGKKEARASEIQRIWEKVQRELRKEFPAVRRIELHFEYETKKHSETVKLESK